MTVLAAEIDYRDCVFHFSLPKQLLNVWIVFPDISTSHERISNA